MLKYCVKCVLPDTKPHLPFDDEGVCDACLSYENRSLVDWAERKEELKEILNRYRSVLGLRVNYR